MGTWGAGILSNDYSSDLYDDFFNLYNEGNSIKEISDFLVIENREILIEKRNDADDFWFTLALAQWECKALEESVFETVKEIIKSEKNLLFFRESDASPSFIKKREKVLNDFLVKLQSERKTAKKIKKKTLYDSIFKEGDCLTYIMNNGNYGGALVLTDERQTAGGANFIAVTTIDKIEKPTLTDFKSSEIYIMKLTSRYFLGNKWIDEEPLIGQFYAYRFKHENIEIEVVGSLKIHRKYKPGATIKGYGWLHLLELLLKKEELESKFGKPKTKLKSSQWIKRFWL